MSEKLISEFTTIGSKNIQQASASAQIYLDLNEVRKFWDVKYFYDAKLDIIYLTGKQTKSSNNVVFIPIPMSKDLSYNILRQYFLLKNNESDSVALAIISPDSTCVYYKIDDGIGDLISKDTTNNREKFTFELRKNRKQIEEAALLGIPFSFNNSDTVSGSSQK